MKILFIAMADNIHTARWISQLVNSNYELHLFPAIPNRPLHPLLKGKVVYHPYPRIALSPLSPIANKIADLSNRALLHLMPPDSHISGLIRLIRLIRPDIVHSLEFQSAGYLTLKARQSMKTAFPKWLATNWGSDIYYFANFKEHLKTIKQLLIECNYYSCECIRDINLAKRYGFHGQHFLSTTNTGGYDLNWTTNNGVKHICERNIIMLKGYQNWSGRAMVALDALKLLGKLIKGYGLVIYNVNPPNPDLIALAKEITTKAGALLTIVPLNTSHEEILKHHGKARVSIGLSLSDALSTSAIEAMVMGSFPIQSNTACLESYVKNGVNGYLVPPEDVTIVSEKIHDVLTNDNLIAKAYEYNQLYVSPIFEYEKVKKETLAMYTKIFGD